jgi:flagellar biosynthesis chaperone FliJ
MLSCAFLPQLEATCTSQDSSISHLQLKLQQSQAHTSEAQQHLAQLSAAYSLLMEQKVDLVGHNMQVRWAPACGVLWKGVGVGGSVWWG